MHAPTSAHVRSPRRWLFGAAAVALVWSAALLPHARRRLSASEPAPAARKAELAAQTAALAPPAPVTRAPAAPRPLPAPPPPPADSLSVRFEAEPSDPEFATALRAQIEQQLHARHLRTRALRAVDCRTTLCRLDFELQSAAELAGVSAMPMPAPVKRAAPPRLETATNAAAMRQYVERVVAAAADGASEPPADEALAEIAHIDREQLEARWASEPEDDEWTRNEGAAAAELLDLFGVPAERLLEVSCRTTVCRVTVAVHEPAQIVALATHLKDERYPVALDLAGGEGQRALAYLLRERIERTAEGQP